MREPTAPQNPALAAAKRVKLSQAEREAIEVAEEARERWSTLRRLGRHGYASTGTGIVTLAVVVGAHGLGLPRGDGWRWMLALVVPLLAGCYGALLHRYDEYRKLAGDPPERRRSTLREWRSATRNARTPDEHTDAGDSGVDDTSR